MQAKRSGGSLRFDDLDLDAKVSDAHFLNKVHEGYVKWCRDIEVCVCSNFFSTPTHPPPAVHVRTVLCVSFVAKW